MKLEHTALSGHRISPIDAELTLCTIIVSSIEVLFCETKMLSERIRQLKVQRLEYNDKDIHLYKWLRERNYYNSTFFQ